MNKTLSHSPSKPIPSETKIQIVIHTGGGDAAGSNTLNYIEFFNQNNKKIGHWSVPPGISQPVNRLSWYGYPYIIKSYATTTPDILSSYSVNIGGDVISANFYIQIKGIYITENYVNDKWGTRTYKILKPYTLPLATSPIPTPTPDKPVPTPSKPTLHYLGPGWEQCGRTRQRYTQPIDYLTTMNYNQYNLGVPVSKWGCDNLPPNPPLVRIRQSVSNAGPNGVSITEGIYIVEPPQPTPSKPIPHPDKPVPSIFNRAYLRVTNKVKSNYKQGQQLPKSKCGYDYNGGEPFTNISEQCNKGTNTNLINNGGYFCGTGWDSVPKCEYATEAGYTVPEAITAPGKCKSYPKTPSNPSDQNWPNFSDGGADSTDPHVCYDIKTQNCWKPNMNQLPRYPVCQPGDILVNNPTPKPVPTHKPIIPGVPTPKPVPTHKPIIPGVPTPKPVPTHKPIIHGVPTPKHVPTHKHILPGVPTPHTVISTRVVPKPGTRDIPDDKDLVTLADQHITSMQQGTGSRTVPSSYFKDYCPI